MEPKTLEALVLDDAEKLRALADCFDLPENRGAGDEVQVDLRRIADGLSVASDAYQEGYGQGYEDALSRSVVSVEEISEVVECWSKENDEDFALPPSLLERIHALQLRKHKASRGR